MKGSTKKNEVERPRARSPRAIPSNDTSANASASFSFTIKEGNGAEVVE